MHRFKHHVVVLVLYGVLTRIFTVLTLHYITNSHWLADSINAPDGSIKLWDVWVFDKIITGEAQFYHTDTLFYPDGLDLTYHTFHLPQMLFAAFIKPFTGLIGAFNLVALIFTWITAYSISSYMNCYILTPQLPQRCAERESQWRRKFLIFMQWGKGFRDRGKVFDAMEKFRDSQKLGFTEYNIRQELKFPAA